MATSKPSGAPPTRRNGLMDLFTVAVDGRLKSTFLLYAFSLSFLCIGVYVLFSLVLVKPLDTLLAGGLATFWINLIEALVPAIAGTLILLGLGVLLKDKRLLPAAFGLLLFFALVLLCMAIFSSAGEERAQLLWLYLLFIPAPVLVGGTAAWVQYRHYQRRQAQQ